MLAETTTILSSCYRPNNTDWVRMPETPGSALRPYTETSALGDILEWSKGRPGWLRDALRWLMVGGELSDQDIDELEEVCLGSGREGSPLTGEHIAPQRLAGKPVAITGLRDPVGVNALASDQGLTFAASGLTIIYGDNGSGKIRLCARAQERVSLEGQKDGHLAGRAALRKIHVVDPDSDMGIWVPLTLTRRSKSIQLRSEITG